MTDRWRAALRVTLFVVAVLAVVAIAGAGVRIMLQRGTGSAAQTEPPATAQPQGPPSLTRTLLGLYLSLRQSEITQPSDPDNKQKVSFRVERGESAATIGTRLEREGLIRDAELFSSLVRYRGVGGTLQAGDYLLSPSMTMDQIIDELQHGRAKAVMVTIPEGWRMEQVAAKLAEAGLGRAEEYLALMRKHDYPYAFLKERPADAPAGLEGFLFPDTYEFPTDATPAVVVDTMLRTFDRKVSPELRKALTSRGLSFYEAMTLAAIVEREAVVADERPTIAAVFLSRLDKGMYLQADPTVSYAKGFDPKTQKWWTPMTAEESKEIDSPYNTFLNPGLTPGPICSPGLASIEAVAHPANQQYLYFVSKGDGSHAFAMTLEEHIANIRKYQK